MLVQEAPQYVETAEVKALNAGTRFHLVLWGKPKWHPDNVLHVLK